MHCRPSRPSKVAGFTLIEVMIVVSIVGILAAVAYPSYKSSIVKTRRGDIQLKMVSYAQALERYYTTNGRYTSSGTTCGVSTPSSADDTRYYTWTVKATSSGAAGCAADTFFVLVTPVAGSTQAGNGDQTFDHTGAKGGDWVK